MMNRLTKIILKGSLLGAGAVFGAGMVVAWTGPTGTAPNSNVPAPLNVSSTAQTKSGTLQVQRLYDDNAAYYIDSNVTSVMNAIDAAGTVTAARLYSDSGNHFPYTNGYNYLRGHAFFNGVLYDENNTGYYLDPSNFSSMNNLNLTGRIYTTGDIVNEGTASLENVYVDSGGLHVLGGYGEFYNDVRIWDLSSAAGTHYVCWNSNSNHVLRRNGSCGSSDARLKEHIKPITKGLAEIVKLNPVEFEWKDEERGVGTQLGLVAQDVKEVIPEAVTGTGTGVDGDYYGLNYDMLSATMIKAIQELKAENDELRAEFKELRALVEQR